MPPFLNLIFVDTEFCFSIDLRPKLILFESAGVCRPVYDICYQCKDNQLLIVRTNVDNVKMKRTHFLVALRYCMGPGILYGLCNLCASIIYLPTRVIF